MIEYPIEKAYEHDTILYKKADCLKTNVTIYAPENVYFVVKKDGNTINYYAHTNKNSIDKKIVAHPQPEREFNWDNNDTTITTKVFDPELTERSSNPIHTDNAIQY